MGVGRYTFGSLPPDPDPYEYKNRDRDMCGTETPAPSSDSMLGVRTPSILSLERGKRERERSTNTVQVVYMNNDNVSASTGPFASTGYQAALGFRPPFVLWSFLTALRVSVLTASTSHFSAIRVASSLIDWDVATTRSMAQ